MPRPRLGRGFSPSRWLRRAEGLQRITEGGNGQEWILARGLCAYTTLDGAAVPSRKRQNYAQMAIARWAPFPDAQSLVEWVGDRAMVWAWSKSQVLSAGVDDAPLPVPRRIVPESLYRGGPQADGQELVAMDQGYEGRVWQQGFLAAARWWSELPDLEDWNQFRRGVGLPPASAAGVPQPIPQALADKPWTASQSRGFGAAVGEQRRLLAALAACAAAVVLFALLVSAAALKFSIWQVDKQIHQRELALDKIIVARDKALADRAAIEAQLASRPPAGQIQLLFEVDRLMGGGWRLQEWRMPDPARLELVANKNNPDARAIVSAWEGSGRFKDVTAEIGRTPGEIKVSATIVRPPAGKKETQR